MNIRTLAKKEAEYKSGNLPVALYKNTLVSDADGKNQYYAMTISRGVCTDEDIANDIVISGLLENMSKEQILSVMETARNARLARLADGYAVDDGICKCQLKIKGSFESESDTFSRERHSVSISSHPTASAKKVFSEIEPVIRQGEFHKAIHHRGV